jgi:hypothetical protein
MTSTGSDPYITNPVTFAGGKYPVIKMRYRVVENTNWTSGWWRIYWYQGAALKTYDAYLITDGAWYTLTIDLFTNAEWFGKTISSLRMDMQGNAAGGNILDIDYIAIGSYGYGAQQGVTGVDGVTGLKGVTGVNGATGVQGVTGIIGNTGIQGINLSVISEGNAGTTGVGVNIATSTKKLITVIAGGVTGVSWIYGSPTGLSSTIKIAYNVNESTRWTGIKWPGNVAPVFSGYTGVNDIVNAYYDGTGYYGNVSLGYV